MYDDDLMDVDLADRPMPSIRRSPMRRFVRNAICEIATWAILFLLAALIVGAVRGDQSITVKPGRIKKLETTLAGKTFLWRLSGGDADLIPDSNGKSAITLFPAVGEFEVLVITAKGDQPVVEAIKVKVEGDGPKPPPGPGPGPNPPDPTPPDPKPVKVSSAMLVVIEETANAVNDRGQWITSKDFAPLYSIPGFTFRTRIVDQDVRDASGRTPANLEPYITRAKQLGLPQWFLMSDAGDLIASGGLPATPAELAATIRRKAGW